MAYQTQWDSAYTYNIFLKADPKRWISRIECTDNFSIWSFKPMTKFKVKQKKEKSNNKFILKKSIVIENGKINKFHFGVDNHKRDKSSTDEFMQHFTSQKSVIIF